MSPRIRSDHLHLIQCQAVAVQTRGQHGLFHSGNRETDRAAVQRAGFLHGAVFQDQKAMWRFGNQRAQAHQRQPFGTCKCWLG